MPKFYSSRQIINALKRNGFQFISQRGSHIKLTAKVGLKILVVIVPDNRREIPHGTFRSILRQSGLVEDDFK